MINYYESWLVGWAAIKIHPWSAEILMLMSLIPFFVSLLIILGWYKNNWSYHPLVKSLKLYVPQDNQLCNAWVTIASDINTEFRR